MSLHLCVFHVLFGSFVVLSFSILLGFIFIFIISKRGQQSPSPVHLPFGTILSRTVFMKALAFVTSGVEQQHKD